MIKINEKDGNALFLPNNEYNKIFIFLLIKNTISINFVYIGFKVF